MSRFYLFDCRGDGPSSAIPALIGGPTSFDRLAPKPATPAYIRYDNPPLSFDGELFGASELQGFRTRFRVYDYGVISLALPFTGSCASSATTINCLMTSSGRSTRGCSIRAGIERWVGFRYTRASRPLLVHRRQ